MNKVYTFRLSPNTINKFNQLVNEKNLTNDAMLEELLKNYENKTSIDEDLAKIKEQLKSIDEYVQLLAKSSIELREIKNPKDMKTIINGVSRFDKLIIEKLEQEEPSI